FAGVVGGADDGVVGLVLVLVAAVGDAGGAEQGEGDGVAVGFGEEVAAEAEHVCPAAQPLVRVARGGVGRFGVNLVLRVDGALWTVAEAGAGAAGWEGPGGAEG